MATQRRPGFDPDQYGPPKGHQYGGGAPLPTGPEESPGPPGTQDVPTLPPPGPGGEIGPIPARSGESPRERAGGAAQGGPGGGAGFAPPRPRSPQIQAGAVQPPSPGPVPFDPMADTGAMSLAKPLRLRGFHGKAGGLTGGGFGMPFDPVSDEQSDPISSLIEQLLQSGKVRF